MRVTIENQIVNKDIKINTYVRYIDDIFLFVDNDNQLARIKQIFDKVSGLKFLFQ